MSTTGTVSVPATPEVSGLAEVWVGVWCLVMPRDTPADITDLPLHSRTQGLWLESAVAPAVEPTIPASSAFEPLGSCCLNRKLALQDEVHCLLQVASQLHHQGSSVRDVGGSPRGMEYFFSCVQMCGSPAAGIDLHVLFFFFVSFPRNCKVACGTKSELDLNLDLFRSDIVKGSKLQLTD